MARTGAYIATVAVLQLVCALSQPITASESDVPPSRGPSPEAASFDAATVLAEPPALMLLFPSELSPHEVVQSGGPMYIVVAGSAVATAGLSAQLRVVVNGVAMMTPLRMLTHGVPVASAVLSNTEHLGQTLHVQVHVVEAASGPAGAQGGLVLLASTQVVTVTVIDSTTCGDGRLAGNRTTTPGAPTGNSTECWRRCPSADKLRVFVYPAITHLQDPAQIRSLASRVDAPSSGNDLVGSGTDESHGRRAWAFRQLLAVTQLNGQGESCSMAEHTAFLDALGGVATDPDSTVEITDDPTQACVFVPSINTLCLHNWCCYPPYIMSALLASLPFWDGGRNHLVPHMADVAHRNSMADLGFAAVAKSSAYPVATSYRSRFDVVLPLAFYSAGQPWFSHLTRFHDASTRLASASLMAGGATVSGFRDRAFLFTFKGARYNASTTPLRTRLRELDDGEDVLIVTYCSWTATLSNGASMAFYSATDVACGADDERAHSGRPDVDYDQLMLQTQFAAVLSGEGAHSYRLYEAMAVGAIPVVIGPDAVTSLPFGDVIDWTRCSILQPDASEAALAGLVPRLRAMPMSQRQAVGQWHSLVRSLTSIICCDNRTTRDRMAAEALRVYHKHLRSLERHAASLGANLVNILQPLQMAGIGEAASHVTASSSKLLSEQRNEAKADTGSVTDRLSDTQAAMRRRRRAVGYQLFARQDYEQAARHWLRILADPTLYPSLSARADDALYVAALYNNVAVALQQSRRWAAAVVASRMTLLWGGWWYGRDASSLQDAGLHMPRIVHDLAVSIGRHRALHTYSGSPAVGGPVGTAARPMDTTPLTMASTSTPALADACPTCALTSGQEMASVAIVSLCDYDPSVTSISALSASNKARYCRRHGCQFFFESQRLDPSRPPAWSKILALQRHLGSGVPRDQGSTHQDDDPAVNDWVMWMDCDSFFSNFSIPPHSLLQGVTADTHLVVSEDGVMVNTGVMLLRKSAWSRDFLARLYQDYAVFTEHPWWEQAAMFYALATDGLQPGLSAGIDPDTLATADELDDRRRLGKPTTRKSISDSVLKHTLFVSQRRMNPYPAQLAGQLNGPRGAPLHATWRP